MKKALFFLSLLCIIIPQISHAQEKETAFIFWTEGCPHCAKVREHFESLKNTYPSLEVKEYELTKSTENQELLQKMALAYDAKTGTVPIVFIGDNIVYGERLDEISNYVDLCSKSVCTNPEEKMNDYLAAHPEKSENSSNKNKYFTFGVIGAVGLLIIIGLIIAFRK